MKALWIIAMVFILLLPTIYGADHALLIHLNQYQDPWRDLKNSHQNLREIQKFLTEKWGFSSRNVTVLSNEKAVLSAFFQQFSRDLPNQVKAEDRLFIYFSGHCSQVYGKSGEIKNTLVTYDMKEFFWDELLSYLDKIQAREKIVVVDGLHRGSIFKGGLFQIALADKDNKPRTSQIRFQAPLSWRGQREGGLLSALFLKGVQGAADGDQKGLVLYAELADYLEKKAQEQGIQIERKGKIIPFQIFYQGRRGFFIAALEGSKVQLAGGKKQGVVNNSLFEVLDQNGKIVNIIKVIRVGTTFSEGVLQSAERIRVGSSLRLLAIPQRDWKLKIAVLPLQNSPSEEASKTYTNLIKRDLSRIPHIEIMDSPDLADKVIKTKIEEQNLSLSLFDSFTEKVEAKYSGKKSTFDLKDQDFRKIILFLRKTIKLFTLIRGLENLQNSNSEINLLFEIYRGIEKKRENEKVDFSLVDVYSSKYPHKRERLSPGDALFFAAKSDQDLYINIISIDDRGNLFVCFPNKYDSDNLLRANKPLVIPSPKSLAIRVDKNARLEFLKIIATKAPLNLYKAPLDMETFEIFKKAQPLRIMETVMEVNKHSKAAFDRTTKVGSVHFAAKTLKFMEKIPQREKDNLLFLQGWTSKSVLLKVLEN